MFAKTISATLIASTPGNEPISNEEAAFFYFSMLPLDKGFVPDPKANDFSPEVWTQLMLHFNRNIHCNAPFLLEPENISHVEVIKYLSIKSEDAKHVFIRTIYLEALLCMGHSIKCG